MRIAERTPAGDHAALENTGNGLQDVHFERFRREQRRQDAGQALRQHRLARARRPDHQQMMVSGSRDFERPLGAFLAFDVLKVAIDAPDGGDTRPAATGPEFP